MATWKKVLVSGSAVNASTIQVDNLTSGQVVIGGGPTGNLSTTAINGSGNILATTGATGVSLSGSFSGSHYGDGSALTGIAATSLSNSLTAGAGLNNGGGTFNGSAARTFSVDSGSMLPYYSGSVFARVSGDVTITAAGVATIQPDSVALGTDTTGNYVATLGTGTGVTIGSNTGEGSSPTIAVNYGSTSNTAVQGNTNFTLNGTANQVSITGTAAQALGAGPTYTVGLPSDVTISNNLTVNGDLAVQGTTTTFNTTEILVEDKFILLASGSTTATDGGIIIDRGSDSNSNVAYGYDSTTGRWGFQNGITDTTNVITIGTNGGSAFVGHVFTEAQHTSTKPTTGEFVVAGAMYVSTAGDIFIYS